MSRHPGWPARLGGAGRPAPAAAARRADLERAPAAQRGLARSRGSRPRPQPWAERHSVASWPSALGALRRFGPGRRAAAVHDHLRRPAGRSDQRDQRRPRGAAVVRRSATGSTRGMAGRGITPTAVAMAIDHCFGPVGLHRVEVDIRPENVRSLRVVEKLGFRARASTSASSTSTAAGATTSRSRSPSRTSRTGCSGGCASAPPDTRGSDPARPNPNCQPDVDTPARLPDPSVPVWLA